MNLPQTAMILAAGKGTRMLPLTKAMPKACVKVNGKMLIDHVLDRAMEAGIRRFVINLHYCGGVLRQTLAPREGAEIVFSEEDELLETGGGVLRALPILGEAPFFVLNCDSLWLNGAYDMLHRLANGFDAGRMDGLLALYAHVRSQDYMSRADFLMAVDGRLSRPLPHQQPAHVFLGASLLSPSLFADAPAGAFSLNKLFNQAIEAERLFGLVHDGLWFHVSTPEDVSRTEMELGLL